jgi:uncharacterized cofD-like protein
MKNIVYIGGGGGVSAIVPALKDHHHVTAIMTTFDDGGSYATFRRDYKSPLTGDIRRALSALSTNGLGTHAEYRFQDGAMQGHTVGNVLLASLFSQTDHPQQAMDRLHEIFAVKGKVLGVSYDLAELQAELKDRSILRGEHVIDQPHAKSHIRIDRIWLDPEPKVAAGVLEAIKKADLIIMGPGDLFCSTIPSLLVEGVSQAIEESKAHLLYFCNNFTKNGQTNKFTAYEHIREIEKYLTSKIGTVVLSESSLPQSVINKHSEAQEGLVELDIDKIKEAGYSVHTSDLHAFEEVLQDSSDKVSRAKVRYKPEKVLEIIQSILPSI